MRNKQIILFSGTTEGRTLSSMLSKEKIEHTICVATEYGENVQMADNSEYAVVNSGRLDVEQMKALANEDTKYYVDATHPFSDVVSQNIKDAAAARSCEYIRVVRDKEDYDCTGIHGFENLESLIKELNKTTGNVLITTGSKEISKIVSIIDDPERLFVRVIPSVESLELCKEAGIQSSHIIAMQGPFGVDINVAVMKQYNIKFVVTRDSGKTGGYSEKIEAAKIAGAECYVIERPNESGLSLNAAFAKLSNELSESGNSAVHKLKVNLIGIGMGNDKNLTVQAKELICYSQLVFGAARIIENIEASVSYPYYLAKDIIPVIESEKPEEIAVLFSGDTGFFSGADKFSKSMSAWAEENKVEIEISVVPGISSVSYFASKIRKPYSESNLLSVHGRNSEEEIKEIVKRISRSKSSYLLVSGGQDVNEIYNRLSDLQVNFSLLVGSRLSYSDENIFAYDKALLEDKGLYVCYIEVENPASELLIPYIRDEEFDRNDTPMTKEVIRHESVRRLNLKSGDVVYDIGSGTGSVSLEIARLSDSLKVFSVEMKESAIEIQKQNVEKLMAGNITVIEGKAPEALKDLPKPQAVFIGGSSGKLSEILDVLSSKSDRVRVVINAISLETMAEISNLSKDERVHNLEIDTLAISRSKSVGNYNLMQGQNPVTIASFDLIG